MKRPTAPLKPGASGSGSTLIVTGFVGRSSVPPLSKKPVRASPMRKTLGGIVDGIGVDAVVGEIIGS